MRIVHMKIGVSLAVVAVTLLALGASAQAISITVDPDSFPAGSVLTNAFPGVMLTTRDGLAPGTNARDVWSVSSSAASTGTQVFAHDTSDSTWGNGVFEFLRADFAGGASMVSLDFAANDSGGDENAQLLAFNAAGVQIGIASLSHVNSGSFQTLSVSAPNIAYVAAYWDEINRISNGALDNLSYTPAIPEPVTMVSMFVAISGLGAYLRKRRLS